MSKKRFPSYAAAEAAAMAADKRATCLAIALGEVLAGTVQWFDAPLPDGRRARFGLVRPTAPHGGIVIVQQGIVTASYLDEWADEMRRHAGHGSADCQAVLPALDEMLRARSAQLWGATKTG